MHHYFRHRLFAVVLAAAAFALLPLSASAQRSGSMFGSPHPARNVAGQFDYYALVLSWSPTHCAEMVRDGYDPQCHRRDGRRYAFVLHGLWPQYERGFPDSCVTRFRPFVPQPLIDRMLDIMPSPRLVIHEYRKHGTCSGLEPAGYFDLARKLFATIKVPENYVNPFENRMVSPDEVKREFLQNNPQLEPDMVAIVCGGTGNRMREIRVCFNREGQPRACGRNEDQRRLCSASRMFVPPVRATRTEADPPGNLGSGSSRRP